MSHMAQNIDIKCPSRGPRILISSHGDCPTVTIKRVFHQMTHPAEISHFFQGITAQLTVNFKEEDLYPPIFSELYYTGVIEDALVT